MQLGDALLAEALKVLDLLERARIAALQREDIRRFTDTQLFHPAIVEKRDLLVAEALDIGGGRAIMRDQEIRMFF